MRVRKDRQGRVIERLGLVKEGKNANDLQLSIDQRVQALAYRALKRATDENKATSGSMVMLDVKTGEVLAMVNTLLQPQQPRSVPEFPGAQPGGDRYL